MRGRLQQRRENERDHTEMLILQNAEAISGILWSKFLSVDVIGQLMSTVLRMTMSSLMKQYITVNNHH